MTESVNAAVILGLGVLQGITEFLPISSDGHLATAAMLFTVPEASLALTVLLHVGTLLATALVVRGDLIALASASLREVRRPGAFLQTAEGNLLQSLVLACFPTCLLYTSPSPRDLSTSRMPSSA